MPEVTTLAETVATWWPTIPVFLQTGITNAGTEGTNRLIKAVKRHACGSEIDATSATAYGCTASDQEDGHRRGRRDCPLKTEENTLILTEQQRCSIS